MMQPTLRPNMFEEQNGGHLNDNDTNTYVSVNTESQ